MLDGKKLYIFLTVYFILLLLPAYWLPLFETTDARYAEIAREMLASGNFMEPYYNGIKHFHKPPFTYWINALGLYIFGINGFGARFFGAVAAVLILIFTRKTAFVLTDNKETADASLLVLASSILFLVVSRVVSTDIYLVLFTVLSLYFLFRQIYVRKSMSNALLFGLFVGLGFLNKGPVIFLFTILPFVTAKFFDRAHRKVFTFTEGFAAIAVFTAVSLPWYLYVVSINDGLLEYFLKVQTVDRVVTDKFSRSKPFYFFPVIFVGTFIPWFIYFFRNWKYTDRLKTGKAIYLYVLMPFIVFQISTSKLGTYILPFFPVAAIVAAVNLKSDRLKNISVGLYVLLGSAALLAPFFVDYMRPYLYITIPFALLYLGAAFYIFRKRIHIRKFLMSFTVMILLFSTVVYCIIPLVGPYVKGYRILADDIKQYDPDAKYNVLIFRTFVPVLSFYLNDIQAIAFSKTRETQFQQEDEYEDFYIETEGDLQAYLSRNDELLVYAREKSRDNFIELSGYICEDIVVRGGKKVLMHCKNPDKLK